MAPRTLGCSLVLIVMAAGCGKSDPAGDAEKNRLHTIHIKRFGDVGASVDVRYSYHERMFTQNENSAGKLDSKDASTRDVQESWTEVVLKGGDPPAELQRSYQKALVENGPSKFRRTYAERTILYTRVGDRYDLEPEGAPLQDPNDLPFANVALGEPDYFTPPSPVRVGDAWPVDPGLGLPKNADFDRSKSTGEARLDEVYERDGAKFGIIKVLLKIIFRAMTMEIEVVYDGVIDGSSTQCKHVTTSHFVSDKKLASGGSSLVTTDSTVTLVRSAESAPPPAPKEKEMPKEKEKEKMKEKMAKEKSKEQEKEKTKAKEKSKEEPGERGA